MAAHVDGTRVLVEQVFRQRREEVLACESVAEVGHGGAASQRARTLVLSRPFAAAGAGVAAISHPTLGTAATLCVARAESGRAVKVKQVFAVARLVDVSLEGSLGATFNFGSSGMLSVAFESHIQREMFVAALRRQQRDAAAHRDASGMGTAVHAFLTDAAGADAEADAAARAKGLRHERRRVLTAADARRLAGLLRRDSFDDVRAAERALSACQRRAELSSVGLLVAAAEEWAAARQQAAALVEDVEELEARIAPFSQHVLATKVPLERIEHASNTLRRKQQNLARLHDRLEAFRAQLSLPPDATGALARLRDANEETAANLFADPTQTRAIAAAMRHTEALLRDGRLARDYPIAAVAERRAFFLSCRAMVAARGAEAAATLIARMEAKYRADRERLSGSGRIVWRPHTEIQVVLSGMADVLAALAHVDAAAHAGVLRRYRSAMQRVYAVEMHRFFKCIRAQLRRVGRRGPFLLGVRDDAAEALAGRMETSAAGETPRRMFASLPPSPAASTAAGLSPRTMRSASLGGRAALAVDVPAARDEGMRLYNANALRAVPVATMSIVSGMTGGGVGGELRPDVAFAMALEAAVQMVLREEETLRRSFSLDPPVNLTTTTSGENNANGKRVSAVGGEEHEAEGGEALLPGGEVGPSKLLDESLLEVFGGDRLLQPDSEECYLARQLVALAEYCANHCDRLYAVPMAVMIRAYRRDGSRTAASAFCQRLLQPLERTVATTIARCVAEQTASISACRKRYTVHPAGLLACFSKLPAFFLRMEAMHNAMPEAVQDRTEYAAIAQSLVDQAFDTLNYITNLTATDAAGRRESLSFIDAIRKRTGKLLDGLDHRSVKRGFIQQYRHHAFFCAFYSSLDPFEGRRTECYAMDLLRERFDASRALRDRYEELYLTRIVLVKDFPEFAPFVLTAEELAQVHSREELRHHNALSLEAVRRVLHGMPKELRAGIPSASARMKKHFLRDVAGRQEEESFHCTLLQRTWQHFVVMLLQKMDFITSMLSWPMYAGIELPITRNEVAELLKSA